MEIQKAIITRSEEYLWPKLVEEWDDQIDRDLIMEVYKDILKGCIKNFEESMAIAEERYQRDEEERY